MADRFNEMLMKFAAELGIEVRETPELRAARNKRRAMDAAANAERREDTKLN
jgi:hypothetical protein